MRAVLITVAAFAAGACTGGLEKQADDNEDAIQGEQTRATQAESTLAARADALESALVMLQARTDGHDADIAALQTDVAGHDADIAALQGGVTANNTAIDTLQADVTAHDYRLRARHDELLFAWDGDGNYVGRVLDYDSDTLVYSDGAAPVMVFHSSTGNSDPTLHFHATNNCTGSALLAWFSAVSHPPRILVLSTGEVWAPTTYRSGQGNSLSHYAVGTGASCVGSLSGGADSGWGYELAYQLAPFTPGIQIASMVWQ